MLSSIYRNVFAVFSGTNSAAVRNPSFLHHLDPSFLVV